MSRIRSILEVILIVNLSLCTPYNGEDVHITLFQMHLKKFSGHSRMDPLFFSPPKMLAYC